MSEIEQLYAELRPSLRGVSARAFQACLQGLESNLSTIPQHRTQLTLVRLRFTGEKSGDFAFQPGVNVLRAGNDKGKSSILKLIQFCLTGKNDLKKDVDGWISRVELAFELDGVAHALAVDKGGRPRGRLVRGVLGEDDALGELGGLETLIEFKNGKEMQKKLEEFFNGTFGLRRLMGTQKDSRKGSDALLDSPTSYRAYFRGMYINQELGYTALVTDGIPYGNLFMKVVGMLLGVRGIDAFFAVESRLARVENELGKEERYHRRLEASLGTRDLATLDQEIAKLERYVDELKVERTALLVRATSGDLEKRLEDLTERLLALDNACQQTARGLRGLELELEDGEREVGELASALDSHRALAAIQPDRCPICETAILERRRHPRIAEGECILCHEDLPSDRDEDFPALAEKRLEEARKANAELQRTISTRQAQLDELEFKLEQQTQQKRHLQAQMRSAHQSTAELEREIELETRYLGRLEADRDYAARTVTEDGGSDVAKLSQRKQILGTVLRYLRTRFAESNERLKQDFADRVQEYCTTIGLPGLEEVRLDAHLKPRIRQNGEVYSFEELSPGERVRFVLAFYLAMAIATGEDLEYGAHPGLLLIDSPGKEEMVSKDFEAVVELLKQIEERHADTLQVIVATSLQAVRDATPSDKQVFLANDDDPLFS